MPQGLQAGQTIQSPWFPGQQVVTQAFGVPEPGVPGGVHTGVDIGLRTGTPVIAALGGTVQDVQQPGGYGNYVILQPDALPNVDIILAHLNGFAVPSGTRVGAGTQVGSSGWSGYVVPAGPQGAHLHFEERSGGTPIDPSDLLVGQMPPSQPGPSPNYGWWDPRSGSIGQLPGLIGQNPVSQGVRNVAQRGWVWPNPLQSAWNFGGQTFQPWATANVFALIVAAIIIFILFAKSKSGDSVGGNTLNLDVLGSGGQGGPGSQVRGQSGGKGPKTDLGATPVPA